MPHTPSPSVCPKCSEPVQPDWRICPVCESRLQPAACPLCGMQVKENWRRCPACEALLVCSRCGKRLDRGRTSCPDCHPEPKTHRKPSAPYTEPVCGLELVWVAGGTFVMGDTFDKGVQNELPVHEVILDDFYMARHPVTQTQCSALMEENPSAFPDPHHPVEQVSWLQAVDFIQRLNASAKDGAVFMLPTEAQWEYAARSGGQDELYAGGDDINAVAWYDANSEARSHAVGLKKPNGLGLYDMSGNVWEWCRDVYQPDAYAHHGSRNPVVELPGADRVIRGGGWNLDAWSARCARRTNFRSEFFGPALGFRLVMKKGADDRSR